MLQRQLEIGRPNDSFEQEADRVADQVGRMADAELDPVGEVPHAIQRRCAECEEEVRRQPIEDEEEELQTKRASGATPEIGPGLQAQISGLHGAGQPLSPALRAFFEPRFGHDFGAVRIHADRSAGDLAHRLRARAFTAGDRIFFAPSQFQPGRTSGRRLLAHELAHVLQQERLARAVVQRATHAGAADYHDPDNCWAFSDRQPTSQVIGRIEGILEVPDSCQGVIRMTSRFQVAGDWSLSSWLGSGSQLKFEINPIGVGVGQLRSEKSVGERSFESIVSYPLASSNCSTNFAVYVLMIWLRGGPRNFFEVKFSPALRVDGEGRLNDASPAPEVRVDPCGKLEPTAVESPKPLPAPFGPQPEP